MHKPAIFFDRDGTLIDDKGYLTQISQVEFYPETFVALELLKDKFDFFIITNQSYYLCWRHEVLYIPYNTHSNFLLP